MKTVKNNLWLLIATAILTIILTACSSSKMPEITAVNGVSADMTEGTISFEVMTDRAAFDISDIVVSKGASVSVYSDAEHTATVDGVLRLQYGENVFYAVVSKKKKSTDYTIIIRRAYPRADYSAYDTASREYSIQHPDWYTSVSLAAFEAVRAEFDALDGNITSDRQGEVDAAVAALRAAYEALVQLPADYTAFDELNLRARIYFLQRNMYKDFSAVDSFFDHLEAIQGLTISQQSTLDSWVRNAAAALATLEYIDADYTAYEALAAAMLAQAPEQSQYEADSWQAYVDAKTEFAGLSKSLKIDDQSIVDAAVASMRAAWQGLKIKSGETIRSLALSGYKTEFDYGEGFDRGALRVLATSDSGTTELTKAGSELDITDYDAMVEGTYTIRVYVGDVFADYQVTVGAELQLKELQLDVTSVKTVFLKGESFVSDGLKVYKVYVDDSRLETFVYTVDHGDFDSSSETPVSQTITIRIPDSDKYATYSVTSGGYLTSAVVVESVTEDLQVTDEAGGVFAGRRRNGEQRFVVGVGFPLNADTLSVSVNGSILQGDRILYDRSLISDGSGVYAKYAFGLTLDGDVIISVSADYFSMSLVTSYGELSEGTISVTESDDIDELLRSDLWNLNMVVANSDWNDFAYSIDRDDFDIVMGDFQLDEQVFVRVSYKESYYDTAIYLNVRSLEYLRISVGATAKELSEVRCFDSRGEELTGDIIIPEEGDTYILEFSPITGYAFADSVTLNVNGYYETVGLNDAGNVSYTFGVEGGENVYCSFDLFETDIRPLYVSAEIVNSSDIVTLSSQQAGEMSQIDIWSLLSLSLTDSRGKTNVFSLADLISSETTVFPVDVLITPKDETIGNGGYPVVNDTATSVEYYYDLKLTSKGDKIFDGGFAISVAPPDIRNIVYSILQPSLVNIGGDVDRAPFYADGTKIALADSSVYFRMTLADSAHYTIEYNDVIVVNYDNGNNALSGDVQVEEIYGEDRTTVIGYEFRFNIDNSRDNALTIAPDITVTAKRYSLTVVENEYYTVNTIMMDAYATETVGVYSIPYNTRFSLSVSPTVGYALPASYEVCGRTIYDLSAFVLYMTDHAEVFDLGELERCEYTIYISTFDVYPTRLVKNGTEIIYDDHLYLTLDDVFVVEYNDEYWDSSACEFYMVSMYDGSELIVGDAMGISLNESAVVDHGFTIYVRGLRERGFSFREYYYNDDEATWSEPVMSDVQSIAGVGRFAIGNYYDQAMYVCYADAEMTRFFTVADITDGAVNDVYLRAKSRYYIKVMEYVDDSWQVSSTVAIPCERKNYLNKLQSMYVDRCFYLDAALTQKLTAINTGEGALTNVYLGEPQSSFVVRFLLDGEVYDTYTLTNGELRYLPEVSVEGKAFAGWIFAGVAMNDYMLGRMGYDVDCVALLLDLAPVDATDGIFNVSYYQTNYDDTYDLYRYEYLSSDMARRYKYRLAPDGTLHDEYGYDDVVLHRVGDKYYSIEYNDLVTYYILIEGKLYAVDRFGEDDYSLLDAFYAGSEFALIVVSDDKEYMALVDSRDMESYDVYARYAELTDRIYYYLQDSDGDRIAPDSSLTFADGIASLSVSTEFDQKATLRLYFNDGSLTYYDHYVDLTNSATATLPTVQRDGYVCMGWKYEYEDYSSDIFGNAHDAVKTLMMTSVDIGKIIELKAIWRAAKVDYAEYDERLMFITVIDTESNKVGYDYYVLLLHRDGTATYCYSVDAKGNNIHSYISDVVYAIQADGSLLFAYRNSRGMVSNSLVRDGADGYFRSMALDSLCDLFETEYIQLSDIQAWYLFRLYFDLDAFMVYQIYPTYQSNVPVNLWNIDEYYTALKVYILDYRTNVDRILDVAKDDKGYYFVDNGVGRYVYMDLGAELPRCRIETDGEVAELYYVGGDVSFLTGTWSTAASAHSLTFGDRNSLSIDGTSTALFFISMDGRSLNVLLDGKVYYIEYSPANGVYVEKLTYQGVEYYRN